MKVFVFTDPYRQKHISHEKESILVRGKNELDIVFPYGDKYQKALQLIKLAAHNQQAEEFEHRKAG